MKIKYLPCKKPNTCKNCEGEFPNWILVDGTKKNLSARSYCLNCKPWGEKNDKRLDKYRDVKGEEQKLCSRCQEWKSVDKEWHKSIVNGKAYCQSHCKDCQNSRARKDAADLKQKAVKYKGSKCYDCNESFPDYIYDFHHLDPTTKDFKLSSQRTRRMLWNKVAKELDKCDMLCAICHRHRHYDKSNPNYCPTR